MVARSTWAQDLMSFLMYGSYRRVLQQPGECHFFDPAVAPNLFAETRRFPARSDAPRRKVGRWPSNLRMLQLNVPEASESLTARRKPSTLSQNEIGQGAGPRAVPPRDD